MLLSPSYESLCSSETGTSWRIIRNSRRGICSTGVRLHGSCTNCQNFKIWSFLGASRLSLRETQGGCLFFTCKYSSIAHFPATDLASTKIHAHTGGTLSSSPTVSWGANGRTNDFLCRPFVSSSCIKMGRFLMTWDDKLAPRRNRRRQKSIPIRLRDLTRTGPVAARAREFGVKLGQPRPLPDLHLSSPQKCKKWGLTPL